MHEMEEPQAPPVTYILHISQYIMIAKKELYKLMLTDFYLFNNILSRNIKRRKKKESSWCTFQKSEEDELRPILVHIHCDASLYKKMQKKRLFCPQIH